MLNDIPVYFKKVDDRSTVPSYTNSTDAACDLYTMEQHDIQPMERILVDLGFQMALPPGVEAQIRPRSGQAWKRGLTVINSPGTIDPDYRGNVKVALINLGKEPIHLEQGERIAQMKFAPILHGNWIESTNLDNTLRGAGGFGSSGRR